MTAVVHVRHVRHMNGVYGVILVIEVYVNRYKDYLFNLIFLWEYPNELPIFTKSEINFTYFFTTIDSLIRHIYLYVLIRMPVDNANYANFQNSVENIV